MSTVECGNMQLWNLGMHPAGEFLKEFNRAGGFRGTAINPMWLTQRATEVFGPIGIGWGYDVVKEELLQGGPIINKDGCAIATQQIHTVRVALWYLWNGQRGEVTHFGQTTFVGVDKNGVFTDEEAPKKSLTDAVSKCLSQLGFGSAIYLKLWDGSKYRDGFDANGDAPPSPPANGNGSSKSNGNGKPSKESAQRADAWRALEEAETAKKITAILDKIEPAFGDGAVKDELLAFGRERLEGALLLACKKAQDAATLTSIDATATKRLTVERAKNVHGATKSRREELTATAAAS